MTKQQFIVALIKLDLTQAELARRLNKTPRNVNRWAVGETPVPTEIAALLNLMIKTKTRPEDLRI